LREEQNQVTIASLEEKIKEQHKQEEQYQIAIASHEKQRTIQNDREEQNQTIIASLNKKIEEQNKQEEQNQIAIASLEDQIIKQNEQRERNQKQTIISQEDAKSKDGKILELQASNKEKDSMLNKTRDALRKEKKERDALERRNQKMTLALQSRNIKIK